MKKVFKIVFLLCLTFFCNCSSDTDNKNIIEHFAPSYLKILKEGIGIFIYLAPFSFSMNCSFGSDSFFCSKHISHSGVLISSGFLIDEYMDDHHIKQQDFYLSSFYKGDNHRKPSVYISFYAYRISDNAEIELSLSTSDLYLSLRSGNIKLELEEKENFYFLEFSGDFEIVYGSKSFSQCSTEEIKISSYKPVVITKSDLSVSKLPLKVGGRLVSIHPVELNLSEVSLLACNSGCNFESETNTIKPKFLCPVTFFAFCDGVDNNCNGLVDEPDEFGYSFSILSPILSKELDDSLYKIILGDRSEELLRKVDEMTMEDFVKFILEEDFKGIYQNGATIMYRHVEEFSDEDFLRGNFNINPEKEYIFVIGLYSRFPNTGIYALIRKIVADDRKKEIQFFVCPKEVGNTFRFPVAGKMAKFNIIVLDRKYLEYKPVFHFEQDGC